jgi:chorismate mutase / prephenate dehydratase
MSSEITDLKALRRRLDEIDARLQDLLIDRAEVVSLVAASKKAASKKSEKQAAFQPAREAEIIRRLVARHRGAFPVASLVRMWREMLAATVRLQSPFSVAVFASAEQPGLWDLARDHYGSNTPMTAFSSAGAVVRSVSSRESTVGVLPMPQAGEPDPWWPLLVPSAEPTPRVIARLPFAGHGNARTDGDALTIGFGSQQKTGLDRTLLALACAQKIDRARTLALLSAGGLTCTFFAACDRDGATNLDELEGSVPTTDPRLDGLQTEMAGRLDRLWPMGGYAVPLSAAALTSKG